MKLWWLYKMILAQSKPLKIIVIFMSFLYFEAFTISLFLLNKETKFLLAARPWYSDPHVSFPVSSPSVLYANSTHPPTFCLQIGPTCPVSEVLLLPSPSIYALLTSLHLPQTYSPFKTQENYTFAKTSLTPLVEVIPAPCQDSVASLLKV